MTAILAGYYEPGEHGRRAPESLYGAVKMWATCNGKGWRSRGARWSGGQFGEQGIEPLPHGTVRFGGAFLLGWVTTPRSEYGRRGGDGFVAVRILVRTHIFEYVLIDRAAGPGPTEGWRVLAIPVSVKIFPGCTPFHPRCCIP